MNQLSKYKTLINEESIDVGGIKLYPIRMKNYVVFSANKPILSLRLGSLPAVYARFSYLGALYAMDYDAAKESKNTGCLASFFALLSLSTNGDFLCESKNIRLFCKKNDAREIEKVSVRINGKWIDIGLKEADKIRATIAFQNGVDLPDEADNPELIEAQQIIAAQNAPQMDYNIAHLMDAVAFQSNVRMKDLQEWTIWEFTLRAKTISRSLAFTINGIIEGYGVKWKNGNPCPSWCYDRKINLSSFFRSEESLMRDLGKVGHIQT